MGERWSGEEGNILDKCLSSIQNLDHVRGSNSPRQEQCRWVRLTVLVLGMYYLEEVRVVDRTNEGGKILDILRRFRAEVSDVLGDTFVDMLLFGSYSRGDFSEFSDVDVLILVKSRLSREEKERIDDLVAEYSLRYDIVISCIIYPLRIFEEYNTPFLLNVKGEGIKI